MSTPRPWWPYHEILELMDEIVCDFKDYEQPPDVDLVDVAYCARHALDRITTEAQVLSGWEALRRERLGLND